MTKSTSGPKAGKPQRTISERLALLSGLAGAAVLGGEASAAVVAANGSFPLRGPSTPGSTLWDVDGDSTNDFQLTHLVSGGNTFGLFSALNGGKQVAPTYGTYPRVLRKLSSGSVVSSAKSLSFAALVGNVVASQQPLARMTSSGEMPFTSVGYPGYWSRTAGETGFFGFSFTSGSDTFYGWGEMLLNNVPGTDAGYGFEITRYYDNAAGTAITVGAVPEPTSIALLAIGAGGLAAFRRRRRAAEAS